MIGLSERYGETEYRSGKVLQRCRSSGSNVRLSRPLMSLLSRLLYETTNYNNYSLIPLVRACV